jgi:NTP pyrophosphatase (non-canonical NTP hydrolase)
MDLNEYQDKALDTAIYPNRGQNLLYTVLGLVGEAGEVADDFKNAVECGEIVLEGELAPIILSTLRFVGGGCAVAQMLKKEIRDNGAVVRCESSTMQESSVYHLEKEIGGVLWYLAAMCHELSAYLGDVAKKNLEQLHSRQERGKLKGSGDDR